jgi:TrmH family RNA methyltransferase
MAQSEVFENISVVLVETLQPGNLGSAARAMKNMGLKRLKLVNPCKSSDGECQKLAVGAFDLVENAQVFTSLEEALSEESIVVGTTSVRGRSQKVRLYTPREISPIIWDYAVSQKVSVVFGPERRGLSEKELALCQYLVSIPASLDFPTLNLAQAVLILAYEIAIFQPMDLHPRLQLATESVRKEMFQHMEEVLIQIGFLSRSSPGHIMRSIRRFLSQAELTERDVRIVRGMMSQMEWYAREGKKMTPEEVEKP